MVAVGTTIADRPPAQNRTSGTTAYGSHLGGLASNAATRKPVNPWDTRSSRCVGEWCGVERCSPWPAPFSPQAPPKIAPLCWSGSSIVWRGPTPPERACPPCGFGPPRTGLVPLRGRGAPEVSRFSCMLFLSVRGFFDYAGPTARSRLSRNSRVAFLQSGESRHPGFVFFEAQ